jgi:hypothetical protein
LVEQLKLAMKRRLRPCLANAVCYRDTHEACDSPDLTEL